MSITVPLFSFLYLYLSLYLVTFHYIFCFIIFLHLFRHSFLPPFPSHFSLYYIGISRFLDKYLLFYLRKFIYPNLRITFINFSLAICVCVGGGVIEINYHVVKCYTELTIRTNYFKRRKQQKIRNTSGSG
jgi:hypothetical protein